SDGSLVSWEAEVALQQGETELVVDVVDETGKVNFDADVVKIQLMKVPTTFSLDTTNQRVVGVVGDTVVAHDLFTKSQRIYANIGYINPAGSCFDPATDNFYYVTITYDDTGSDSGYSFRRINLSSGSGPDVVFSAERDDEA